MRRQGFSFGVHSPTTLKEPERCLFGNHLIVRFLIVRFPNGGRWVVRVKLTAQGELVPKALELG